MLLEVSDLYYTLNGQQYQNGIVISHLITSKNILVLKLVYILHGLDSTLICFYWHRSSELFVLFIRG